MLKYKLSAATRKLRMGKQASDSEDPRFAKLDSIYKQFGLLKVQLDRYRRSAQQTVRAARDLSSTLAQCGDSLKIVGDVSGNVANDYELMMEKAFDACVTVPVTELLDEVKRGLRVKKSTRSSKQALDSASNKAKSAPAEKQADADAAVYNAQETYNKMAGEFELVMSSIEQKVEEELVKQMSLYLNAQLEYFEKSSEHLRTQLPDKSRLSDSRFASSSATHTRSRPPEPTGPRPAMVTTQSQPEPSTPPEDLQSSPAPTPEPAPELSHAITTDVPLDEVEGNDDGHVEVTPSPNPTTPLEPGSDPTQQQQQSQDDTNTATATEESGDSVAAVPRNDQALPKGWSGFLDENTGATYYANTITGSVQWERPTMPAF